jgi:hypothetical protein
MWMVWYTRRRELISGSARLGALGLWKPLGVYCSTDGVKDISRGLNIHPLEYANLKQVDHHLTTTNNR